MTEREPGGVAGYAMHFGFGALLMVFLAGVGAGYGRGLLLPGSDGRDMPGGPLILAGIMLIAGAWTGYFSNRITLIRSFTTPRRPVGPPRWARRVSFAATAAGIGAACAGLIRAVAVSSPSWVGGLVVAVGVGGGLACLIQAWRPNP
ncbi:MAG TPA: hypothetical protein VE404_06820 [Verrucomicrobiae bacterium]|nr:hypothetical protein [Verrucomicrobiae bacterium]